MKRSVVAAEYVVDAGLLREHEKHATQELGQWREGTANSMLKDFDLTRLTGEQLERLVNGDDPVKVILGRSSVPKSHPLLY